eukprot:scaffold1403_cov180-Ochromonas_danica.AAC.12
MSSSSSLPPEKLFSLEVIKEGSILGEIPLEGKSCFLLGRQADVVDIPLDHPSISRKHALLLYQPDNANADGSSSGSSSSGSGSWRIKDLHSAQGTIVNKKRIATEVDHPLRVGDVIQFAASTRLYHFHGPEHLLPSEYSSAHLEDLRRASEERIEKEKARRVKEKKREEEEGISWGMHWADEEEEEEEEGGVEGKSGRQHYRGSAQGVGEEEDGDDDDERFRPGDHHHRNSKLPSYLRQDENYDRKYGEGYHADIRDEEAHSEKEKEVLAMIRKKEKKIQNMEEENRRIFMKEQQQEEGLTEGQLAAVSRNDQQIATLTEEIQTLIGKIRQKVSSSTATAAGGGGDGKRRKVEQQEEESDVLDTSAQTADLSTNWRLRKKLGVHGNLLKSIHQPPSSTTSNTTSNTTATSTSTSSMRGKKGKTEALTYEEISSILSQREEQLSQLKKTIDEMEEKMKEVNKQLIHSKEVGDDDIEVLIRSDELKEIQSQYKSYIREESQGREEIQQLAALLKVATPALPSLTTKTTTATTSSTTTSTTTSAIVSGAALAKSEKKKKEEEEQGSGSSANSGVGSGNSGSHSLGKVDSSITTINNKNKKRSVEEMEREEEEEDSLASFKKFVEDEKVREEELASKSSIEREADKKVKVIRGRDSMMVADSMMGEEDNKKSRPVKGPILPPPPPPSTVSGSGSGSSQLPRGHGAKNMLEGGDYVWVPPKTQKGDGRTALNDKLGY